MDYPDHEKVTPSREGGAPPSGCHLTGTPPHPPPPPHTSQSWTHNFFIYEEDDNSLSSREMHMVPWDMDNSFGDALPPDQPIGNRPAFDAPVCDAARQASETSDGTCILCNAFESTGGLSESRPPSCFRLNRAFFGLGLRKHYMEAAADALNGPLRLCNIRNKLNRWKASIEDALATDASEGLWPAMEGHATFEGVYYPYDDHFHYFRDTQVPKMIEGFRATVACGEGGSAYSPEDWGELYSSPIGGMMDISDFETGPWEGGGPHGGGRGWGHGGGGDGGGGGGVVAGIAGGIGGFAVIIVIVWWTMKAQPKAKPVSPQTSCSSTSSSSSASPSANALPSEQMLVSVPPGVTGGQDMLVSAPAGGALIVRVPPNCTQFTVSVPVGTPVSRAIEDRSPT